MESIVIFSFLFTISNFSFLTVVLLVFSYNYSCHVVFQINQDLILDLYSGIFGILSFRHSTMVSNVIRLLQISCHWHLKDCSNHSLWNELLRSYRTKIMFSLQLSFKNSRFNCIQKTFLVNFTLISTIPNLFNFNTYIYLHGCTC